MSHQSEKYSVDFLADVFSDVPSNVETANKHSSGSDSVVSLISRVTYKYLDLYGILSIRDNVLIINTMKPLLASSIVIPTYF